MSYFEDRESGFQPRTGGAARQMGPPPPALLLASLRAKLGVSPPPGPTHTRVTPTPVESRLQGGGKAVSSSGGAGLGSHGGSPPTGPGALKPGRERDPGLGRGV